MTASRNRAWMYILGVLFSLVIVSRIYTDYTREVAKLNKLRLETNIDKSNKNLLKAVVYLTDVAAKDRANFLKNVSSRRKKPLRLLRVVGRMIANRYLDDYRFCRKEAPFLGPYNYISNSKSPCWYSVKGKLLCVPYFYVAGFSKSGTSDVFDRTASHPQISKRAKEIHWLDYSRYFKKKDTIEAYAYTMSGTADMIEKQIKKEGKSQIVIGEGTPSYAWDSMYWPCYEGNRGLTEPKYTNADVIYRLNPKAKIIMMLRDPVARLYSRHLSWVKRFNMEAYKDPSPQNFHILCARSVELYNKCFKEWSHRHCAYNGTLYAQSQSRLQEGMYSVYIKDWLKVFPREQILIIKFEDYIKKIPEYLTKIFHFLDIPQLEGNKFKKICKSKARNTGRRYDVGPMLDETRDLLQKFYAPFNKELQNHLDDQSWAWGYE